MLRLLIPCLSLLCMGAGPSEHTLYRVKVKTDLEFERWNSGYGHTVETADVRYRLKLYALTPKAKDGYSRLELDVMAGSDLGPPPSTKIPMLRDARLFTCTAHSGPWTQ